MAEWAGDLNTEHIYAAGDVAATWGHTAVGVSARGGNDPVRIPKCPVALVHWRKCPLAATTFLCIWQKDELAKFLD